MRALLAIASLLAAYACPEPQLQVDTPDDWPPFVGQSGEGPWSDEIVESGLCFTTYEGEVKCVDLARQSCGTDSQCEGVADVAL